jgi:hypothetical protein
MKMKIQRTVIFLVGSYGCETWSVTVWEVHRLRVFENKILRKVSVPERDKVTGVERPA